MANDQLFIDVLAQIEKHPETWWQGAWRCETGMCFAGWACELSGLEWLDAVEDAQSARLKDGRHAADAAQKLLGIDSIVLGDESVPCTCGCGVTMNPSLFRGSNTLDDLYHISARKMGLDEGVLRSKVADVVADGRLQS